MLLATIFFNFSDIPAKANFSSCRNVFLNKFSIPASGNQFSVYLKQYSFIWRFFSISKNPIFWKTTLFLLVDTNFLVSENHFLNKFFIPAIGERFFCSGNCPPQLKSSFLLARIVTNMSGNHFFKTDHTLASRKSFSR